MGRKSHTAAINGGWDNHSGDNTPILLRWRHSLWKHVGWQLVVYFILYLVVFVIYRYAMSPEQQQFFEKMSQHAKDNSNGVPLTFILGLYIGLVIKRWWDQYTSLPWPDDLALQLRAFVIAGGETKVEERRLVSRTVIRYSLVAFILALRRQSWRLQKRFGSRSAEDVVANIEKTGLLDKEEVKRLEYEESSEMYTSTWWVPLQWSIQILAKHKALVASEPAYTALVGQVKIFKQGLQKVKAYGNLPVPLVYSQVVTLAVYVYFVVELFGEQCVSGEQMAVFDPVFLAFKFLFYFGLLSVANSIYNPWGTDEEDFQVNKLLERHLKVAMAIVDDANEAPELREDRFWDRNANDDLKMLDNYKERKEWFPCMEGWSTC